MEKLPGRSITELLSTLVKQLYASAFNYEYIHNINVKFTNPYSRL